MATAAVRASTAVVQPPAVVAGLYGAHAEGYDRRWSPVIAPWSRSLLAALPLAGARRVLDVGAGTGALLPALQRAAPAATVVGVDLSLPMLQRARRRGRFALAAMDVERLGVRPSSVDVAVAVMVLFHLADPPGAVARVAAALRPGGTFGAVTWGYEPSFPGGQVWEDALDAAGAPPDPSAITRNDPRLETPDRLGGVFATAGLSEVRAWAHTFQHGFTAGELLRVRLAFGSSRRRVEALDPPARTVFLDRVRAGLSGLSAAELTYEAELVFATGTR